MYRIFLAAIIAAITPLILSCDEPSAFGAGNLDNPKPYGLTSSEKVILENKKSLHKVVVDTNNQANKVDSIRDRIDGLQGIVEGLANKSHENEIALQKLSEKNAQELQSSDEYEKRLSEITQNNSKSIEEIKVLTSELSVLLDTVNKTYVTKVEFNDLVEDVNKFKDLVSKELKADSKSKKSEFDDLTNGEVATKAHDYFEKKLYDKAIKYYNRLIDKKYKPARSHYMIAESNYYMKNYAEAIAYFKKSASLYDKASYMPVLMLHTAVAMEKTGDKKNAKAFYNGIISKYPDSEYAIRAKKYLDLIK
jgi:TolA-binding protein